AVEGAMNTTLLVEVIKGGAGGGSAPAWPRIESDEEIMGGGSARPVGGGWRASQGGMGGWLSGLRGLDQLDAHQRLTQGSRWPPANVCDTNYSAVTKVAKSLPPPLRAFGGMHSYLREQAQQAQ